MTIFAQAAWLLAQAAGENGGGEKGAEGGGGLLQTLFDNPLIIPVILILPLMYFMLILPEKRKRAELASMLDNVKKNDRIVTVGGIVGTVVNAAQGSDEITIRVDENSNTRIHVLRSAISKVLKDEDSSTKKDA